MMPTSRSRKKTLKQLQKELEQTQAKPPRMGVQPTKVIPDKTKYKRKRKHKKDYLNER
jgi:hypothetical protein